MTGLIQLRAHGESGITNFAYGNLNGGGYADEVALAPDGSTLMERGNLANSPQWQRTGDTVVNISTSPYMDNVGIKVGGYGSPYGHAYGTLTNSGAASHRIYCICGNMPSILGYAAFAAGWGQLIRSDNNGQTWVKPGPGGTVSAATLTQPISTGGSSQMYFGPKLACDPTNDDILWIMGYNGAIYATFNAGQSWHIVTGVMDAAGLPKCTVDLDTVVPQGDIKCNPSNPINGLGGTWGIFNATNQFCFGSTNGSDFVYANTSTNAFYSARGATRNGTYSPSGGEPCANAGDVIYFGNCGFILIDKSLGTTANPGIALGDTGATGSASNRVYFGWSSGSSAIYKTSNAGGDLTSGNFSAVGTGGPSAGPFLKNKLSNDGTLVGGNNILWVADGAKFWRWVDATPPTGSGLSASTWTSFNGSSIFAGQDLTAFAAVPDPLTAGRVAFINIRAQTNLSPAGGYGGSLTGVNLGVVCTAGDTPWLNADNPFVGDADFDKVDSLKMWIATGCGLYHGQVPTTAGATFSLNGKMSPGLQSLIIAGLVKVPTTGFVITNAQDRNIVFQPDQTTQAAGWFFQPGVVPNTGWGCYALDNPTVMFASAAETYRTTDGLNLSVVATYVSLGNNPIATVSTSSTVTFTESNHGRSNGDVVFIGNLTDFNGVTLDNLQKTIAVTGANTWTTTSSTPANATGSGGGFGINGTGVRIGFRGFPGGAGNMVAKTSRLLMIVSGSGGGVGNYISYGTSSNDIDFNWNPTLFGGNPLVGWGGNSFGKHKPLAIETTTGKIAYMEPDYGGSPTSATKNSFFVSSDGGITLTCPGGTGTLVSSWTGFAIAGGNGAQLSSVTGFPTHWFIAGGVPGDNSVNIGNMYLRRTRDDGVTWDNFSTNTNWAQFVCTGPNALGLSYPSVYVYGLMNGDSYPNFNLYRCDNMTGVSGDTTACVWKQLPNMVKVNCSSVTGLIPDYDVRGRVYVLTGDEGYLYTTLS